MYGMENFEINIPSFWERFAVLLKEKNMMQKTLCEELEIDAQQFSNKRYVGRLPTTEQLLRIARYFETTVEYLVLGNIGNPLQKKIDDLEKRLKQISEISSID